MAFDFKKQYKELYQPHEKPEIITVAPANYIAVQGAGNPNDENGAYQKAVSVLYAVAYTIKMSYKGARKIEGFFEYVVPPLESFWWMSEADGVDYSHKERFRWTAVLRLPGFVKQDDFGWAVGYQNDFTATRLHHESYLSDPRKIPAEKWKTVIRHPVAAV